MILSRLAAIAALSLVSFTPVGAAQPAAMTIYLSNFNYAPKPIHLRAGQPVTLVFVNRSSSSHDFTARAFFANAQVTEGMAMHGMAMNGMAMNGMIDLRGGETKSVTLVPRAGTYKAHCSHFLHKQFGMSNLIVVD